MDLLNNLLSPRIYWIFAPDNFVLEVEAERVECPLNKYLSIPDKYITSFIHRDTLETEMGLWGLIIPNKSCVFFISPFLWSNKDLCLY